jgi:DNA replication protein DnaC
VEAARHLVTVKGFLIKRTGFLVMLGNVGTGKSHLAVAAMREWRAAVFIKQSSLLRELRATYRDRAACDPVSRCQDAGLLVLDEIGLSAGGRDELPLLHEILDYRYGEHRPTILTGNLGLDELRGIIGERLSDRLRECALPVLIFSGPSHRPERRGEYFLEN